HQQARQAVVSHHVLATEVVESRTLPSGDGVERGGHRTRPSRDLADDPATHLRSPPRICPTIARTGSGRPVTPPRARVISRKSFGFPPTNATEDILNPLDQEARAAAEGGIVDAIMLQYRPWLDKDSPLNKAIDAAHARGIGLISMKQIAGNFLG